MARFRPFSDEQLAANGLREVNEWLLKLQQKAVVKAKATSGQRYEEELASLIDAYDNFMILDEDLVDGPAFTAGFDFGFDA